MPVGFLRSFPVFCVFAAGRALKRGIWRRNLLAAVVLALVPSAAGADRLDPDARVIPDPDLYDDGVARLEPWPPKVRDEPLGPEAQAGPQSDGVYRYDPGKRYRKELAEIRKRLKDDLEPDVRAWLLRRAADLEAGFGNFGQAIKDLEAAFETGAMNKMNRALTHFFLGRLYLSVEPPDFEKSIENLQGFVDIAKSSGKHADFYLAQTLAAHVDYRKAVKEWETALQSEHIPNEVRTDSYFYLGQTLAMMGKYEDAVPQALKAVELSDTPNEYHYRLLLLCYRELGRHEDEMALLERMVKFFPDKEEYKKRLKEVSAKVSAAAE